MNTKLLAAFTEAILTHIPEQATAAVVIADALSLSREAAYRRLRGEVPFTFEEAAELARSLNFSLDRTFFGSSGKILFNLKYADFRAPMEAYIQQIDRDVRFFRELASTPEAVFAAATNMIPAEFYFRYENLANFRLFKWMYRHDYEIAPMQSFEQMPIPDSLLRCYRDYVAAVQQVPLSSYVFDDSGFKYWINAIQSFRAMHMLSEQTMIVLRDELFRMVDDLEKLAITGEYANGHKVQFYLSDVDIDACYSYIYTKRYQAVGIEIFSLNALRTTDPGMFEYVRHWVQTQGRFSTLISCSGEVRRIQFFRQQRELIAQLG